MALRLFQPLFSLSGPEPGPHAGILRPPAKGPLCQGRQRDVLPLAGAIGLEPEQNRQLERIWQGKAQILTEPGLIAETFACQRDQRAMAPDDWVGVLRQGALAEVSGAFALAWHQQDAAPVLHLIRDAVGERTLFYAPCGQGLIFASSLELLLAPGLLPRKLDPNVLVRFLAYAYVPGRESLLEGVYELEPGEWLSWRDGKLARRDWWSPDFYAWEPREHEQDLAGRLRLSLEHAVASRIGSGDIACASLSGGLDSSLVVALMRRFHAGELRTFSVSFGPEYRNELPFSQHLADYCGTRHQVLEVRPRTVMHHFDETIALLGNPIGDPLTVPNALIFREASRYGGVLFNGEGGDPNFGGPKNIPMVLAALYGDPYHARLGETSFLQERTYLRSYRKLYEDLPRLLRPEALARLTPDGLERQLEPWFSAAAGESLIQKLMVLNTRFKGAHHILFKVNALSRAFGIQPASPLFDREVTELALRSAPQLKLKGTIEKFILKQAVADLVPERIMERPKSGMQVPVELWFRPGGPLHHEARRRLRRLEDYELFDKAYLRELARFELPGFLPRHGPKIWILLTLEAWLRHYL